MDIMSERLSDLRTATCIIEPLPGRCVIVRDAAQAKSGLIYIPEKAKHLPTTGIIVAVGDEDHKEWLGRRVVWARYSGTVYQFGERHCYDLLTYDEVQGFLVDPKARLDLEDMSGLGRSD